MQAAKLPILNLIHASPMCCVEGQSLVWLVQDLESWVPRVPLTASMPCSTQLSNLYVCTTPVSTGLPCCSCCRPAHACLGQPSGMSLPLILQQVKFFSCHQGLSQELCLASVYWSPPFAHVFRHVVAMAVPAKWLPNGGCCCLESWGEHLMEALQGTAAAGSRWQGHPVICQHCNRCCHTSPSQASSRCQPAEVGAQPAGFPGSPTPLLQDS